MISKIRIDININTKLKKVSQYNPHNIKTTSLSPETIKKLNKYLYSKNKNGTVEEIWKNFKSSLRKTTEQFLPKSKKLFEKKWVTDEVKNLTKKKSLLHFQITQLLQKGESISSKLKNQYTTVKKETKNECRRALNKWWEEKTKKAEDTSEINMKLGRGGSLLKTLKLIGKSRHNQHQYLLSSDGSTKIVTTTSSNNFLKNIEEVKRFKYLGAILTAEVELNAEGDV